MLNRIGCFIGFVFIFIFVGRIALSARLVLDSRFCRIFSFILERIRIEGKWFEVEFRPVFKRCRLWRLEHIRNVLRLAIEPLISS